MERVNEKKLYLWIFTGIFSFTMLFVTDRMTPDAPSLFTIFGGDTLVAAVANATTSNDPAEDTLEALVENGVVVNDVIYGAGTEVGKGSTVVIDYNVKTKAGIVLLDSAARDDVYTFVVGEGDVIRGVDIGVRGMRVGGTRTLVVPPEYAYGNELIPGVPEGESIIFTIKLLGVR